MWKQFANDNGSQCQEMVIHVVIHLNHDTPVARAIRKVCYNTGDTSDGLVDQTESSESRSTLRLDT
jgi:uncharacterized protein (UPF0147 family)